MAGIEAAVPQSLSRPGGRPDLLALVVGLMAVFGVGSVGWIPLDSMNPAANVPAGVWIDIHDIPVGQRKTVFVHGVPIFIAHRTPEEIAAARADDGAEMPFPENDGDRVQREEWIVVVGIDTFRGWYLLSGQGAEDERGAWGGWREHSEAIDYDISGRLRRDRGSSNLIVPSYSFVSETRIEINWPIEELSRSR